MQPRIKSPAITLPGVRDAMLKIAKATEDAGVPPATLELVSARVGQLNGCSVCVDMHSKELVKEGEPNERIFAVAAWRESPRFTDGERAALALAESVTRLSDRNDPVPDDVWAQAAEEYDEKQLAALILDIGAVNLWNRLNASTRQVPGSSWA